MAADPSLRHLQRDAKQEDVVTKRDSYNRQHLHTANVQRVDSNVTSACRDLAVMTLQYTASCQCDLFSYTPHSVISSVIGYTV